MVYQLVVTVQCLSGMVDRVVCETPNMEFILQIESVWKAHERTLMTRVESITL